jgi:hypothetical protein
VATTKVIATKIRKSRSRSILSDSRNAHGRAPSVRGGVCGNVCDWRPITIDRMPASTKVSPATGGAVPRSTSDRHPVSARPAAIHPSVPQTRMPPNSASESLRLIIARELVSARVGA